MVSITLLPQKSALSGATDKLSVVIEMNPLPYLSLWTGQIVTGGVPLA